MCENLNWIRGMVDQVDRTELWKTVTWLTKNTPYRLAGSEQEKFAAEYVATRMREYGLDVTNTTFRTYNSNPIASSFEVTSPVKRRLDSLPCAHIRSTPPEGADYELVYVGNGDYDSYHSLNIKGKLALVEVSYAPPVPEKARIADEMGAAGIVCMNWGNDEKVICHRGLKAVWGNPTEETLHKIPDIIGVGVTHTDGLWLKEQCRQGRVMVHIHAHSTRQWSPVHQPCGILHGNGKSDQMLLICSHLDAWQPGVTCNATGNATTLELCRILSRHREKIDRDIYFVFWNGHEIAEAAGSTWFVDHNWDLLNKKCICYMHIDSTGVDETSIYEIKSSDELLQFATDNVHALIPGGLRSMTLKKIGDQSFRGIGTPAVAQRMSFTKEAMAYAHGATLGWWNHTCKDNLDKCNIDTLVLDTKVHLAMICKLADSRILPYDFEKKIDKFCENLATLNQLYGDRIELLSLLSALSNVRAKVQKLQAISIGLSDASLIARYNEALMSVSRLLTNVSQTYADKYQQDSYGHSFLSSPVPLLAQLPLLDKYPQDSMEYGMIETQLVKNRNRISDAISQLDQLLGLYLIVLKG